MSKEFEDKLKDLLTALVKHSNLDKATNRELRKTNNKMDFLSRWSSKEQQHLVDGINQHLDSAEDLMLRAQMQLGEVDKKVEKHFGKSLNELMEDYNSGKSIDEIMGEYKE